MIAWDRDGIAFPLTSLQLIQEGEERETNYAEWMPYQKGQAAKTEQLEAAARQGDPPKG